MTTHRAPDRLPKVIGFDGELGNFMIGAEATGRDTCREASAALLAEIDGHPRVERRHVTSCNCIACAARWGSLAGAVTTEPIFDEQDRGRKFLPNGHCCYVDLDHFEIALPEVRSAKDFVAAKRAALHIARRAQLDANAKLRDGKRVAVLLNNSDGQSHSYGTHYNFLITRACWDRVFGRKLHNLLWLASYQATAAPLFGAGKVGSENGVQPARYVLSARADFIEVLMGPQTTSMRPLCNSRDEPLCGSIFSARRSGESGPARARSHVICFDHALVDGAVFLTAGVGQLIHAMLEGEWVSPALILEDPIDALLRFSHDPSLTASAELLDGRRVTAVELQRVFLEEARRFAERDGFEEIVPGWPEILDYWDQTLAMLAARDLNPLSRRLDWALKLRVLHEAMRERPELAWESPEMKHLDLVYASNDDSEGLFHALDGAGETERLVTEDDVARFVASPPEDTRAWTRGELLRRGSAHVDDVDWDRVSFKVRDRNGRTRHRVVELPDPAGGTKAETQSTFASSTTLAELLGGLGATVEERSNYRDTAFQPYGGHPNEYA